MQIFFNRRLRYIENSLLSSAFSSSTSSCVICVAILVSRLAIKMIKCKFLFRYEFIMYALVFN